MSTMYIKLNYADLSMKFLAPFVKCAKIKANNEIKPFHYVVQ